MKRLDERDLFARRAALPAPPPPPFADVLAKAKRRDQPSSLRRLVPHLGVAAAAAIAGLFLTRNPAAPPRDLGGEPLITAEPLTDLACVESPPAAATREAEGVISGLESDYHACLLASPSTSPREAMIKAQGDQEESMECGVTCGPPAPRECEGCDEAACEGSHE